MDGSDSDARRAFEELVRSGALYLVLLRAPHHRIGPIVAERMSALGLDAALPETQPVARRLRRLAEANVFRNRLMRAQLAEAVALLSERGIPACLIKGAVSLADEVPDGYLSFAARRAEDLDLVVTGEQADAARSALEERGWLCTSGTQRMPALADAPALIDLHAWSPDSPEVGFLPAEAFFEQAVRSSVSGHEVRLLPPEHAVRLRLVHNVIRQHLFVDFPLCDLYEMARIIRVRGAQIDWPAIHRIGLRHEVAPVFGAVLVRLREEFGAPVPAEAVPEAGRAAARAVLRRLDALSPVPAWLYGAASRYALISATAPPWIDKVNRAIDVLISAPLEEQAAQCPMVRAVTPLRTLALHAAVVCWRFLLCPDSRSSGVADC